MWRKFLLEEKQNYGISDHGLWLNSLDIILVDLKSRDFNTLRRWGRGTALGQIYKELCEVPVVAASELLSCELIMTSASKWLQGCCAELLMYCSENAGILGRAKCFLWWICSGRPRQKKQQQQKNNLSMGSGMTRKLEENSRMNGEITKVRCNKLAGSNLYNYLPGKDVVETSLIRKGRTWLVKNFSSFAQTTDMKLGSQGTSTVKIPLLVHTTKMHKMRLLTNIWSWTWK